jgi:hypothetical protein
VLGAGAQQGLNILREGFLDSSNASINISRIITSDTIALSPVYKGKQLIKAAIEGLRDLVLLATRA